MPSVTVHCHCGAQLRVPFSRQLQVKKPREKQVYMEMKPHDQILPDLVLLRLSAEECTEVKFWQRAPPVTPALPLSMILLFVRKHLLQANSRKLLLSGQRLGNTLSPCWIVLMCETNGTSLDRPSSLGFGLFVVALQGRHVLVHFSEDRRSVACSNGRHGNSAL